MKRPERDGPEKEFPMNTNRICALAFAAAMLVGGAAVLSAAEPSKEDAALSAKLITAIEKADYESFITEADAPVKKALTKSRTAGPSPLGPGVRPAIKSSFCASQRSRALCGSLHEPK